MANKESKRLVIDASVARSAGGEEATHPTPVNCRDFLLAVLEICHRVVMTREIQQEWNKHQSGFTRTWRRTMIAKKKLVIIGELTENKNLWDKIEKNTEKENDRQAMYKDFLLIEAALATDKIVISLDENAHSPFAKVSLKVGKLRDIMWINPDKVEEEQPIQWLKDNAPREQKRCLGNQQINK